MLGATLATWTSGSEEKRLCGMGKIWEMIWGRIIVKTVLGGRMESCVLCYVVRGLMTNDYPQPAKLSVKSLY